MESDPLPFACTTNLEEQLDRASLRRFLVKLRFDWLTETQVRHAFRLFFGLPAPAASVQPVRHRRTRSVRIIVSVGKINA
jgi:hypothetical protein